jgi:adenine phosphoribosyltransferase
MSEPQNDDPALAARERIRRTVRTVPNWPLPGVMFRDITPLLSGAVVFKLVIGEFLRRYRDQRVTAVAGLDARGFIMARCWRMRWASASCRSASSGKLPFDTVVESYSLEYRQAELEVHTDAAGAGDRVVLIDDLIATGGTMRAGKRLLERLGAHVVEGAAIIDLPKGSEALRADGLPVFCLVSFEGH